MEAGEGGSVLEKLESCGPMREFEIIWVTKHILKGLDFLHSKKVIHHDIKRESWGNGTHQIRDTQWQAGSSLPIQFIFLFYVPEGALRMKPGH